MASLLLRPRLRPQVLGLGLGLSFATLHFSQQLPVRLEPANTLLSPKSYEMNAQTPLFKRGQLNPRAVRQISSGSIIGLCAGMAVSTFSRSLALLIGFIIVGVQWATSYGINVLPYGRLQRYITSVDLKSAIQNDVAFKLSFGLTFVMAAFMRF